MVTLDELTTRMAEAVHALPGSLSDPKVRAVIFAVLVLAVLWWIASSLRRLGKQVALLSSELSAVRSLLKKIEWALGRIEEKKSSADRDKKNIFSLPLRENHDKTEWK